MGAQIRVYRQKIASTRLDEEDLQGDGTDRRRHGSARRAVRAAGGYARTLEAITRAVSAVARMHEVEHVLTSEQITEPKRAAVLIMTSRPRHGRGLLRVNALRHAESPARLGCSEQGNGSSASTSTAAEAQSYFDFRDREIRRGYGRVTPTTPDSDQAREIGREAAWTRFLQTTDEGGVDELYMVYTRFKSHGHPGAVASSAASAGGR